MRSDSIQSEVHGALALTLHMSRLLGVAPLRMERVRGGWRISFSRALTLYSYLLLFALHVLIIVAMVMDTNLDIAEAVLIQSITLRLVIPFEAMMIIVTVTVAVYQASGRMEKIITSQNVLQKIQTDLKKCQETSTEKRRYICAVFCILLAFYPTLQYLYTYLNIVLQKGRNLTMACFFAAVYVEFFIIILVALQFVFVAMNIKSAFEAINNKFEDLVHSIDKKSLAAMPESNQTVHHLTHCFGTVCDAMRNVEGCFSELLLLIIGAIILLLVVVPLNFFYNLISGATETTDMVVRAGTIFALTIYLMVICEPGYRTERELQRTRSLTDQLLRQVSVSPCEDFAQELDLLFKQISFNSVSYTPLEVSTLNRSLITGVIGTAITLTVIVLQYQCQQVLEKQKEMKS